MHSHTITDDTPRPGAEEPVYTAFVDDDRYAYEWSAPDAAIAPDGEYECPDTQGKRERGGVTSIVRIAKNLQLTELVRELREEQRRRERVAVGRFAAGRRTVCARMRRAYRRAAHRPAARAGVSAAGAEDPDPEPDPTRRPAVESSVLRWEVHDVG